MKRITRKWKQRLKKGLMVFTTDPISVTHQKRIIRGEKDFTLARVNGATETEALEKAFQNAAGGANEKYNAALAAAYKASPPAKNIANKVLVLLVFLSIVVLAAFAAHNPPVPVVTGSSDAKHTTWQMATGDYGNNRWFADGITEIRNAQTDTEATAAARVWVDGVKRDPNLLVGAVKIILERDVDSATLSTSDGWASNEAVQLTAELELTLGRAKISSAAAPADGYNTGVENNTVVAATAAGISGDRKAVQATLADGRIFWIIARCGNIVTPSDTKPSLPPGKTDNTTAVVTINTITVTPIPPIPPTPHYWGGGGGWTPPTPLQPKSPNVADYQRPGTDSTTDSGTGVKPIVPWVTTPAESTPPVVITSRTTSVPTQTIGNETVDSIIDTPTNSPSSETGVTAPGATEPTSTSVPTPEPSVNPSTSGTDTGTNTGDPGNPFE